MAQRTDAYLRNYTYNNVKPNNNNEITGLIIQNLIIDIIDSVVFKSTSVTGTVNVSQTSSNITPDGNKLNIPFIVAPKYGVTVNVNGQSFEVGDGDVDDFYVLSPTEVIKSKGQIEAGDILYYNVSNIGFYIDNLDVITLNYLYEE